MEAHAVAYAWGSVNVQTRDDSAGVKGRAAARGASNAAATALGDAFVIMCRFEIIHNPVTAKVL